MDKQIYYVKDGQRVGPIKLSDFIALNMPGSTLVWYEGLESWLQANQAPVTAGMYGNIGNVPPTTSFRTNIVNEERPPKPDTYLVWAILTTVLCCLPFGIVSIIYACKVDSRYYAGDYDEAEEASQRARIWAIASAISGLVFTFIYIGATDILIATDAI